ncbi:MAG: hypothetical protein Kow0077_18960 [Anaerolineae bacterium]
MFDTGTLSNAALFIVTLAGMYIAAFWLAMIIWTFRDHRARSRDGLASFAAALMVAVLGLPGLVIYLMLRPRETLAEAYERSLEEEALLQEIEEKPICPGCTRPTHPDWQVCPHCHTTLKKPCIQCGRMLDLPWSQCPYCATVQPTLNASTVPSGKTVRQQQPSPQQVAAEPASTYMPEAPTLEYIEDDPYRA